MNTLNRAWDHCYLAEVHTLDSFTAQSRTNRRAGACLTGSDDELYNLIPGCQFSRHLEVKFKGMFGVFGE